jgi:hypothetical protein
MCNCAEKVDTLIYEKNLRLVYATIISKDMELTSKLCVATEKIDTKIRKKPPFITVSFCPFCGEKL